MVRIITSATVALLLTFAGLPAAHAGETSVLAQKAEELAASGKHVESLSAIHEAYMGIWNGMPLGVRKILFVSREPGGYGVYEPRIDNIFKQGEQLIVYSEPVGFGWQDKGGVYFSDISVDFVIRSPSGEVLAEQKSFGRFTFTSREQNTEYMARVNFDLSGAPPGSYVLALTFNDQIDSDSATSELPFEIR